MKISRLTTVFLLMILVETGNNPLAAQPAAGITLTKSNLKATLENLGFETKDLGADSYQITLTQGATVPISVSLSQDGSRIWLITFFGEKVLSNYTSDKLIKFLQSNRNMGVSFFALNGNKLQMLHPIENRNITPVILRKEIESQTRNVSSTILLWNDQ